MLSELEHVSAPVLPRRLFALRLVRIGLVWLALTGMGLTIGMAGYALTEDMAMTDAFLNAAMILSGMGPVTELHTRAGKLFAGFYAIFSGLFIVVATGLILTPILHRVLHVLHVDDGDDDKADKDDKDDKAARGR
ncbi:MAG: hypothetical protein HEQ16_06085 [Bosea sp.]|jgi:hypothetical protein|nr:hypothetical protein [Bosea sp. (in: a-proteobacteria)]